nr:class I SAM-dependent methyltransferase [uncultured Granulicatella sp.]
MNQNHYYTHQPNSKSQEKHFSYVLKGFSFQFVSDNGVFSKNTIDFGSQLLIESYEVPSSFQEGKLLDVGCGYGPMGLSFAKAYPKMHVEMVDVNERALELARRNAKANGIENVSIHESSIYDAINANDYSVIISNPPIRAGKEVVHRILEEANDYLIDGGQLVIVIQKKQGAPSAQKKMQEVFGNVERIALDKGYWILVSTKEKED